MPVYEYECVQCGVFADLKPMREYLDPQPCPQCWREAPRVLVTAPAVTGMDAARRTAIATNERSANAPRSSAGHGAGCGCCTGMRSKTVSSSSAKMAPSSRPWMISH